LGATNGWNSGIFASICDCGSSERGSVAGKRVQGSGTSGGEAWNLTPHT
jgi:hypothetical protein